MLFVFAIKVVVNEISFIYNNNDNDYNNNNNNEQ